MVCANYCYIFIENFPKKFSPCEFQTGLGEKIVLRGYEFHLIVPLTSSSVDCWRVRPTRQKEYSRQHYIRVIRAILNGYETDTSSIVIRAISIALV